MEPTDENYQQLGDLLLQEIRAKNSVKYPTLTELLAKLQASLAKPACRYASHTLM